MALLKSPILACLRMCTPLATSERTRATQSGCLSSGWLLRVWWMECSMRKLMWWVGIFVHCNKLQSPMPSGHLEWLAGKCSVLGGPLTQPLILLISLSSWKRVSGWNIPQMLQMHQKCKYQKSRGQLCFCSCYCCCYCRYVALVSSFLCIKWPRVGPKKNGLCIEVVF